MNDREKLNLASELLKLLGEDAAVSRNTETVQTIKETETVIESGTVTETEYVPRRSDMAEISDFFCRDSRRYDNGFEVY